MDFSNHSKGITSVKVHHMPGGASNFSLSHDEAPSRGQETNWGQGSQQNNNRGGYGQQQQQRQNPQGHADQFSKNSSF